MPKTPPLCGQGIIGAKKDAVLGHAHVMARIPHARQPASSGNGSTMSSQRT